MNLKKFSIIFVLYKLRKFHACPVNTSSCSERFLPLPDNLKNSSLFKDILHPVNLTTCEDSNLSSINNASNSSNFNFSSINASNFSSLNINGSNLSKFLPWTTCPTGQLQLVPHELRVRWNIVNTCEIFWIEYFLPDLRWTTGTWTSMCFGWTRFSTLCFLSFFLLFSTSWWVLCKA